MRKLLCVVLLAVATPVSAHAAVPIGSEPASHPVAVGQEVVWVRKGEDLGKGAAVFEIVATKLDGSSRVLATTPRPTATHDLEPTVTPFASPERLAYLRTDYVREGKYQYPTQDSIRLFDGPSPEPLAACGRFGRMSAAVAGRALVYTNCEATRLVVDEPGTGASRPSTARATARRSSSCTTSTRGERCSSSPPRRSRLPSPGRSTCRRTESCSWRGTTAAHATA